MNFERVILINPNDNTIIKNVDASTSEEIDSKVILARKTFLIWSKLTVCQRIQYLQKLYQVLNENKEELAHAIALEVGIPKAICLKIDIAVGLQYMLGYLENAPNWLAPNVIFKDAQSRHIIYYEPYGVVGISIPWNYPFCNFVWAAIQNIVVGNTIVIKHSEHCILVTQLLENFIKKCLPEGVCNVVYGKGFDVGNYLMRSDIDMIWFTGSTQTGLLIYQIAAQKGIPVVLELGGSAPGIVCHDADLEAVIPSIYINRFVNSGQTCDGLKRLIVHESIFQEVVDLLAKYIDTKKIGSALNVDTDIGPLVNKKQQDFLQMQVDDACRKGAKIVRGGKRFVHQPGTYFEPTILTNISYDMDVWRQEVFGPVLPIVSFTTTTQAINLANDTPYGLGAYVYTHSTQLIHEFAASIKTGNISVNSANYVIPQVPFGGCKKSGIGRTHGAYGLHSLCCIKIISESI